MIMGGSKKNFENFQFFPEKLRWNRCLQFSRCSDKRSFKSVGTVASETFLHNIDFVDGKLIRELSHTSIQKFGKGVRILRYNNHSWYVNSSISLFKIFCSSTCHTFFSQTGNLGRHLVTCNERVKYNYQKNFLRAQRNTLWQNKCFQDSL